MEHQEFIIGLLEHDRDITASPEIFKQLLTFNDENFQILKDRCSFIFNYVTLEILIDCFECTRNI